MRKMPDSGFETIPLAHLAFQFPHTTSISLSTQHLLISLFFFSDQMNPTSLEQIRSKRGKMENGFQAGVKNPMKNSTRHIYLSKHSTPVIEARLSSGKKCLSKMIKIEKLVSILAPLVVPQALSSL